VLCDDERERAAPGKISQFEQKLELSRHVLGRATAIAVKALASLCLGSVGVSTSTVM